MDEVTIDLLRNLTREVRTLQVEVMSLRAELRDSKVRGAMMDIKEAGEYLHISVSTMKNRMADGCFPWAIKKGRKWLFPADKIQRYAKNI